MARRNKFLLIVVLFAVGILTSYLCVQAFRNSELHKQKNFDWQQLEKVCTIGSLKDFQTSGQGIRLDLGEDDWIVILYRDDHPSLFGQNYALARTKDGAQFESEYHFCGYEGLNSFFHKAKFQNFDDFLQNTSQCNWRKVSK